MKLSKETKKNLLLVRLGNAFENTYHNATLSYIIVDDEHCEEFDNVLQFYIQYEFDKFAESIDNAYCQMKKYKKNDKIRESKMMSLIKAF